ncbi:MAG: hypothetical protein F6K42_12930 [Leptolyngbya sp. SIO1D8]|nr:hypothetical protein [Leptolyngbya sp. SIO1D8]
MLFIALNSLTNISAQTIENIQSKTESEKSLKIDIVLPINLVSRYFINRVADEFILDRLHILIAELISEISSSTEFLSSLSEYLTDGELTTIEIGSLYRHILISRCADQSENEKCAILDTFTAAITHLIHDENLTLIEQTHEPKELNRYTEGLSRESIAFSNINRFQYTFCMRLYLDSEDANSRSLYIESDCESRSQ